MVAVVRPFFAAPPRSLPVYVRMHLRAMTAPAARIAGDTRARWLHVAMARRASRVVVDARPEVSGEVLAQAASRALHGASPSRVSMRHGCIRHFREPSRTRLSAFAEGRSRRALRRAAALMPHPHGSNGMWSQAVEPFPMTAATSPMAYMLWTQTTGVATRKVNLRPRGVRIRRRLILAPVRVRR